MPKMNGYKLVPKIRNTPPLAAIPIVICTVENHAEDIASLIGVGYVKKLANPEDIIRQVKNEIEGKEALSHLVTKVARKG